MFTDSDRRQELSLLLNEMRTHPSRDWNAARERALVLSHMLARHAAGRGSPTPKT